MLHCADNALQLQLQMLNKTPKHRNSDLAYADEDEVRRGARFYPFRMDAEKNRPYRARRQWGELYGLTICACNRYHFSSSWGAAVGWQQLMESSS
jgi:hypothetical protein